MDYCKIIKGLVFKHILTKDSFILIKAKKLRVRLLGNAFCSQGESVGLWVRIISYVRIRCLVCFLPCCCDKTSGKGNLKEKGLL